MYEAWLAAEHSRRHLIEQWPDGPRKKRQPDPLWMACFEERVPMNQGFAASFAPIGGTARRSSNIPRGFKFSVRQI
jgi:hypothetical protein